MSEFQIGEEHENMVTLYHRRTRSHVIVRIPFTDQTGNALQCADVACIRDAIKELVDQRQVESADTWEKIHVLSLIEASKYLRSVRGSSAEPAGIASVIADLEILESNGDVDPATPGTAR